MSFQPTAVDVGDDGVVVTWSDEHVSSYGLIDLRRNCMCAQCRELRTQGAEIWPRPGVPDELSVSSWSISMP